MTKVGGFLAIMLMSISSFLYAQEKSVYVGLSYTFAKMENASINRIYSEANAGLDSNAATTPGYYIYDYYVQPEYYQGFGVFGTFSSKHWASSFGLRTKKITSYAGGEANITSTGNIWDQGIKIQHTNFFYDLQWNLVFTKYLRFGPALGFDASFIKGSIRNGAKISHQAFIVKSSSFTLDGTASFGIYVGNAFQFFLKPYIQYSAFKANLWGFEQALNGSDGHIKSDYEFMIKNYGIIFGVCFGKYKQ